jgi:hypothetical protein
MFPVIIRIKDGYTHEDIIKFLNNNGCHEPKILTDGTISAHVSETCFHMAKLIVASIQRV